MISSRAGFFFCIMSFMKSDSFSPNASDCELKVCFRMKDVDILLGLLSPHNDLLRSKLSKYRFRSSACSKLKFNHEHLTAISSSIQQDVAFGHNPPYVVTEESDECIKQGSHISFTTIEEWLKTIEQPHLSSFPVDKNLENKVRDVHRALFSSVKPTPFKSNTVLVIISESALTDCLDLDLALTSSPLLLFLVSGNYEDGLENLLPKPLTHRYGGHQFGYWAGQLGDGRAHLIGSRLNKKQARWEMQLKGSGRTPFSRQGDGRAVLRSSVREFLACEAMFYLGIPTSRAASLVVSDDLFARDQFYDGNVIYERGAIVMRLAPSWFRFGSLEVLTKSGEFDLLQTLADFMIDHHFPKIDSSNPDKYLMLFQEIVMATAHMIAHWQCVGFTHGVCNTDNFSLLSITIDYGPFGFMDAFDPKYVPNASDDEARYSYENQVKVGLFNLEKLRQALLPLWNSSERQTAEIILTGYNSLFKDKYFSLFSKKFGLQNIDKDVDEKLTEMFLKIMHESKSDFTLTFRHLGENSFEDLINRNISKDCWTIKLIQKHRLYDSFLKMYSSRLKSEGLNDTQRRTTMSMNNPRYVLRNWMAEKAINLAEKNDFSGVKLLYQVLKTPYVIQEEAEKNKFADKPPSWASHIKISCSS